MGEVPRNEVLVGDVRARLRALPDGSVHCIVTSPPYYGLRSYLDLPPAVWGGEAECEHVWGPALPRPGNEYREGLSTSMFAGCEDKAAIRRQMTRGDYDLSKSSIQRGDKGSLAAPQGLPSGGAFCQRCGAWRGHFGLEPLHDCGAWARGEPPCSHCYICNLRSVLAACWRVLRGDGLLFLNLGDSYASTGTGKAQSNSHVTPGQRCDAFRHAAYLNQDKPNTCVGGIQATSLTGIPERAKLAAMADGWLYRSDIHWWKPSCMPESSSKRPTRDHEYVLMLSQQPSAEHFFDAEAVRQPHADAKRGQAHHESSNPHARGSLTEGVSWVPGKRQYNPAGRNIRTTWRLKPEPSNYDFCLGCDSMFVSSDRKAIETNGDGERACPHCGATDGWVAHYAAFPSGLPRRCILAGTSAAGACPDCGKPWERVVQASGGTTGTSRHDHGADSQKGMSQSSHPGGVGNAQDGNGRTYARRTLGWRPGCGCNADLDGEPMELSDARKHTVPCVVCDPFSGTGTTGVVAAQLGRDYVGIEASPSYVKLSRERIRIFGTRRAKLPPPAAMPLFKKKGE